MLGGGGQVGLPLMDEASTTGYRLKRIFGIVGVLCWLLILPAKLARHFDSTAVPAIVGVVPSILGPAGLLFVMVSSEGWSRRLSFVRVTALAAAIALGLEFAQLLPGVRRIYRFDWYDVAATILSIGTAAFVAAAMWRRHLPSPGT